MASASNSDGVRAPAIFNQYRSLSSTTGETLEVGFQNGNVRGNIRIKHFSVIRQQDLHTVITLELEFCEAQEGGGVTDRCGVC